ncbi:uncharacterized protein LOC144594191 [Rhinoraja longicauda]
MCTCRFWICHLKRRWTALPCNLRILQCTPIMPTISWRCNAEKNAIQSNVFSGSSAAWILPKRTKYVILKHTWDIAFGVEENLLSSFGDDSKGSIDISFTGGNPANVLE